MNDQFIIVSKSRNNNVKINWSQDTKSSSTIYPDKLI